MPHAVVVDVVELMQMASVAIHHQEVPVLPAEIHVAGLTALDALDVD